MLMCFCVQTKQNIPSVAEKNSSAEVELIDSWTFGIINYVSEILFQRKFVSVES